MQTRIVYQKCFIVLGIIFIILFQNCSSENTFISRSLSPEESIDQETSNVIAEYAGADTKLFHQIGTESAQICLHRPI